jgi:hypothetical protein
VAAAEATLATGTAEREAAAAFSQRLPKGASHRVEASGCFSSKKASRSNSRARHECNSSRAAWSAKLMSRWPQFNNKFNARTMAGVDVKGTLGPRRWTGQARESDLELDSSLSWTVMASPTSSRRSNRPTRRRAVFPGLFCLVRRSCRARYPRQPRPHPSLETGGPR